MKLGLPWSQKLKALTASGPQQAAESGSVHQRLDDLTRQLERLSKITEGRFGQKTAPAARSAGETGPAQRPQPQLDRAEPQAPIQPAASRPSAEPTSSGDELDHPVAARQINRGSLKPTYSGNDPNLDKAIAEIVARQHTLDDERPPAGHAAETSRPRDLPAQDLSGLDRHLRHITEQIESLRRPIGIEDIAPGLRQELSAISHSLSEAMPRQAIEAVEAEVHNLAERLDQRRQSGIEASALAAMEQSLAEIRDALQSLKPAESLVGFPSAIEKLACKIDSIAAAHNDPAVLQQLESAITGLRSIVAHVASDDALGRLTEEVRGLAAKIEEMADANARGGQLPAGVEGAVRDLSDKIERLQLSPGDAIAFGQLEDRIARLVEKLDASGARLGHIETLERGLADVLVHLEEQRSRGTLGGSDIPVVSLKRDMETTNAMLGSIVERLASIESGMRGGGRGWAAPPMPPAPQLTPDKAASRESWSPASAGAGERSAAATQFPHWPVAPAREHRPIDPSLPPDHPLEPGSTARPRNPLSPADRVAASEAALGPARPSAGPDAAGRADFIAAARRAAQAAAQTSSGAENDSGHEGGEKHSIGERLSDKMRSLLVGSSVVAVTLGAFHVATVMVGTPDGAAQPTKVAEIPAKHAPAKKFVARLTDPTPIGALGHDAPAAVATLPSPPSSDASPAAVSHSAPSAPKPETPAKLAEVAKPQDDVTGSIPTAAAAKPNAASPAAAPAQAHASEPDGLTAAATAGNPAAAYLLAERLIDGDAAQRNYADAAQWLQRAVKEGLAPAQFRLGGLYEKGLGVKKDLNAARRLYAAAAAAGNGKAMHNLAVLYAEGVEGKPDYKTAAQWFRNAADHGVSDSQYNLAVLYARGVGVQRNLVEAYKWFALAAQRGDKESEKNRDRVAGRLDAESLMAAKLAVKTWKPEPQPEAATTVKAPAGGWPQTAASAAPASSNSHKSLGRKARAHSPLQLGPG